MAQNNDVIDLRAAAGAVDEHVTGGSCAGGILTLDRAIGAPIVIDCATGMPADEFVVSGMVDTVSVPAAIVLTMSSGGTVRIDVPPSTVTDKFVVSGHLDFVQSDLVLTMNDGTTVAIDLSMLTDTHLQMATYNCATNEIEMYLNDGTMIPIDMTCFISAMYANERGGVVWDGTKTYLTGDIVTENGLIYVALSGSTGTSPAANPAVWKIVAIEKGGILWNNASVYAIGDMVTYADIAYTALTVHAGSRPDISPGDWKQVSGSEQGGVAWNSMGVFYSVGDVVVESGVMFTCSAGHISAPGDLPLMTNPSWTDAFIVSNVDPGAF